MFKKWIERLAERNNASTSAPFSEICLREQREIQQSRIHRGGPTSPEHFAVAFSGGGIRSAAFNLGVIQALAWKRLLSQIDYISTVSGGGYIGSWLISWIQRTDIKKVEDQLYSSVERRVAGTPASARYLEPDPIRYLRQFTSYLLPKAGLMGGDLWAAVAIYLRNVLLTQLILIALCVCVLIGPIMLVALSNHLWFAGTESRLNDWLAVAIPGMFVAVAVLAASLSFRQIKFQDNKPRRWTKGLGLVFVGCLTASSALSNLWLLPIIARTPRWQATPELFLSHQFGQLHVQIVDVLTGACLFLVIPAIVGASGLLLPQKHEAHIESISPAPWKLIVSPIIAGAFATVAETLLFLWITASATPAAYAVMLGVPATLAVICLTSFLHIGLMGNSFEDAFREWLGRACGYLLRVALAWLLVTSISVYAPLGIEVFTKSDWGHQLLGTALKWLLPGGWVASTLLGVLGGHSSASTGNSKKTLDILTQAAPPIFLVGLLIAISWGIFRANPPLHNFYSDTLLRNTANETSSAGTPVHSVDVSFEDSLTWVDWPPLAYMFLAATLVFWGVGQSVDINEFSMHLFYKNRLTRTFLGASHQGREPNLFTGFDPNDDIHLSHFRTDPPKSNRKEDGPQRPYYGPYPIYATALNVVSGNDLAMQTRKARSFIYSPYFVGFDHVLDDGGSDGYRPTESFSGRAGPHIGTAMTISGAAASPNSGYHTNPAVAALMTFFNVRLGWWGGNPLSPETWRVHGPKGPHYLFNELITNTNDTSSFVYLSDGGHFENLGIYELVRRRVKYVICSDADQDEDFGFCDIGTAIEKCRRDFGVEITFLHDGLSKIRRCANGFAEQPFALAEICYPAIAGGDGENAKGWLLYLKTTLPAGCPTDVLAYAQAHPNFPHDPTANQFFDENQFESYRRLGEFICRAAIEKATPGKGGDMSFEKLFTQLRDALAQA